MSTTVVINESPKYKLSITDGTDQSLSVTNGIELQVTANVGQQGPAGPDGTDALWNFRGEWVGSQSEVYDVGDVVTYNGSLWYCIEYNNGTEGLDPESYEGIYWQLIAAKGADATVDFSSPEPIGDVTPNTGAFTSLSATGAFEASNSSVKLSQIPTFENNAAASSLAAGSVYKTSTGELRIKY